MDFRMPEAMKEPKALLSKIPLARYAVLSDNSLRLYHFDKRN